MLYAAEIATSADITATLTALGSVFTFLMDQIGSLVTLITSQPLLLIPVGVILAYTVVKFFKKIFY